MPIIPIVYGVIAVGGLFIANKAAKEAENHVIKIMVIAGVAYVAWINRGALAKLVKVS